MYDTQRDGGADIPVCPTFSIMLCVNIVAQ